jgi:hypothetical protein
MMKILQFREKDKYRLLRYDINRLQETALQFDMGILSDEVAVQIWYRYSEEKENVDGWCPTLGKPSGELALIIAEWTE